MRHPYVISNPEKPKWVCTACFSNMIEIGKAYDEFIVYDRHIKGPHTEPYGVDGKYALLAGQGHMGDENHFFLKKPNWNKNKWINLELKITVDDPTDYGIYTVTPNSGYDIICHASKEFGYDYKKHGLYEYWFLNCVSLLVNAFERKYGMSVEEYWQQRYNKNISSNPS